MKVRTFGRMAAAGFGAVVALVAVATPAAADPIPANEYRVIAGAGSDTTQDVLNGLGNVIRDAGNNKIIASWDARDPGGVVPAPKIKTKAANCTFTRPNGSGAGHTALRASEGETGGLFQGDNVVGCVDFARSSSFSQTSPTTTGNLTYIPFGVDAVTYAKNVDSDLPNNLTFVQLQRIYRCLTPAVSGTPVSPMLLQSGSGTRQFWLQKMGITENDIAAGDYPCIDQGTGTGYQEHDGTVLNGKFNSIVPFSVGQYVAQTNTATILAQTQVQVDDRRGPSRLGAVNGLQPVVGGKLNIAFRAELVRDVYNVVPTADLLAGSTLERVFSGPTSLVCQNAATIELFGFGVRTTNGATLFQGACGSTALKNNA